MTKIAVDGDVIAIPGTIPYTGAASGVWVPGSVTYSSYSSVKVGGSAVIYEAKCTFSFTGVSPSPANAPVSGTEDVTLTAGSTEVNKGQNSVLLDGDSKTGNYGNQLQVIASPNPAATG
jgi:hypothetical protein